MTALTPRKLHIAQFKNVEGRLPVQREASWQTVVNKLLQHTEQEQKGGVLFSPVLYKPNTKRGKKNVESVSALLLDFDNGTHWDELTPSWEELEYVIYTTHSHTLERPKWRAVFPLVEDIPAEEWPAIFVNASAYLGRNLIDESCKDCSRIWYWPTCAPGAPRSALHHPGKWLDARALPEAPNAPRKKAAATSAPVPAAEHSGTPGEQLVAEALLRCGSGRNPAGFWLACQLRDERYSYDDARRWMEEFTARVFPIPGEPPYTLGEALHSLDQAFSDPPREPRAVSQTISIDDLSPNGKHPNTNGKHPSGDGGKQQGDTGATRFDFLSLMTEATYIFIPDGNHWPAGKVNGQVPPVCVGVDEDGNKKYEPASRWLDRERPAYATTWAPGLPQVIEGRLIAEGGWIERPGCYVYNQYRPPICKPGDPADVDPWWHHLVRIYGEEQATHLLKWFAHRVQHPGEKLNHAIVLGGAQGIGKDTILEPVKYAVGDWNWAEVSPVSILGRFNGFRKSVVIRVSEARDMGDVDRYSFYEHLKIYTAAPPNTLRVDEKNRREYSIPNVCSVILTTNHLQGGIYLPQDDRRHYVVWSPLTKDDFPPDYWRKLWGWYASGGIQNVAAYLRSLTLHFDAKMPPPKTEAFHTIVNANRAPEDEELSEIISHLGEPKVLTKEMLCEGAAELLMFDFKGWMEDRRNGTKFRHRLEAAGYIPVRNPGQKDGRWMVKFADAARNVQVYGLKRMTPRELLPLAERLT